MNVYIERRMNPLLAGCIMLIFGGFFLRPGFSFVMSTLNFQRGAVSAEGTIIRCAGSCTPTVRFRTQSGQSITISSDQTDSSYYVGKLVQVKYHPKTPQDGRLDSFVATWLGPLVVTLFILFLLLGGIALLLRVFVRRLMGLPWETRPKLW